MKKEQQKEIKRRRGRLIRFLLFGSIAALAVVIISDINYAKSGMPDNVAEVESQFGPTILPSPQVQIAYTTPTPTPFISPRMVIAQSKVKAHILMYHYINTTADPVNDPIGYNLTITPAALEKQITTMEKLGYHSITVSEAVDGKGSNRSVALTFDDGYEDFYTNAFPVLKEHGWTATLYIISGRIGGNYMTTDQLRELHDYGIEIGAHTIHHVDLAKSSLSVQQFEIEKSKSAIESIIDAPVRTFAYPSGKYTIDTTTLVAQAGLSSAVTTYPGVASPRDDVFQLPRIRISPNITEEQFLELMR